MSNKIGMYPFTFFEATNGKNLSKEIIYEIETSISKLTHGLITKLNLGEIGCSHSHLMIYKYIVENSIPLSLILEDDVNFTPEGHKLMKEIFENGLAKDIELLILGYSADAINFSKKASLSFFYRKIIFNRIIGIPTERNFGSYGYLITKNGAKKLLSYGIPLRMQADILLTNSKNAGVLNYTILKPCIIPDLDNDISSIGQREDFYLQEVPSEKNKRAFISRVLPRKVKITLINIILTIKNKSKDIRKFSMNPWKFYVNNF